MEIVQDTNVLVAALRRGKGSSAAVLARCLTGEDTAVIGQALLAEHEDLLARGDVWAGAVTTPQERERLLDDLCAAARFQPVFFLWRPNLPDEQDNHVLELALAGGVPHLVTWNAKDFQRGELKFQRPRIVNPPEHLKAVK